MDRSLAANLRETSIPGLPNQKLVMSMRWVTRAYVEPDQDFFTSRWIRRWEEPEIQLASIGRAGDGNQTGVRLANVKIDVRNRSAIDGVLWTKSTLYPFLTNSCSHTCRIRILRNDGPVALPLDMLRLHSWAPLLPYVFWQRLLSDVLRTSGRHTPCQSTERQQRKDAHLEK